jgi:hypothetical protein
MGWLKGSGAGRISTVALTKATAAGGVANASEDVALFVAVPGWRSTGARLRDHRRADEVSPYIDPGESKWRISSLLCPRAHFDPGGQCEIRIGNMKPGYGQSSFVSCRSQPQSRPSLRHMLLPSRNLKRDYAEYQEVRTRQQPENPFAAFIPDQEIAIIPSFTLESGETLRSVPVAYTTRGELSPSRDNAMVICHALTGSADVSDWWGPMLGPGRAFDTSRYFVICMNSLGSPYGTASPVTAKDGDPAQGRYGPEFPLTTIRDDVRCEMVIRPGLPGANPCKTSQDAAR